MRIHIASLIGTLALTATATADDTTKSDQSSDDETRSEVFFEFDSSALSAEADARIAKIAKEAKESDANVVLDGHADPIGDEAYNVGLSARRADAVRYELIANGIDADRIVLAIYGEDAAEGDDLAKDRRVAIEVTHDPLYKIVDRTFPVGTAVMWEKPATVAEIEGPPSPEQTARQ